MSTPNGSSFARDMLMGAGVVVMLALVWAAVARLPAWIDATVHEAVRNALQETRSGVADSVERDALQEAPEGSIQEAVDAAVQEARQFFQEVLGLRRNLTGPMNDEVADLVTRFTISQMTGRFRMSAIDPRQRLEEVDIDSQWKLDRLKARLSSTVKETFDMCLREQQFQDDLGGLSTRTSVRVTAERLIEAVEDGRMRCPA